MAEPFPKCYRFVGKIRVKSAHSASIGRVNQDLKNELYRAFLRIY